MLFNSRDVEVKLGLNTLLFNNWPDLGPFPVDVPQTLVLGESRLFFNGPDPWADLNTSCLSSKEETIHSLLSSRSVYCRHMMEQML